MRRRYVKVDGVEWCSRHHGVLDEISDRPANQCDLSDGEDDVCEIHTLYFDRNEVPL